jgi:hypothetical protein
MPNNTLLVEDTATKTLRKSNYQDIERECRERQKWTHISLNYTSSLPEKILHQILSILSTPFFGLDTNWPGNNIPHPLQDKH